MDAWVSACPLTVQLTRELWSLLNVAMAALIVDCFHSVKTDNP